mmetsp:Transcript_2336/g.9352  ORF Transcript_2336/g.9352 Transcript_2336/m.9352 type:complete len:254 (-) Transcript_2336:1128-1889(-)
MHVVIEARDGQARAAAGGPRSSIWAGGARAACGVAVPVWLAAARACVEARLGELSVQVGTALAASVHGAPSGVDAGHRRRAAAAHLPRVGLFGDRRAHHCLPRGAGCRDGHRALDHDAVPARPAAAGMDRHIHAVLRWVHARRVRVHARERRVGAELRLCRGERCVGTAARCLPHIRGRPPTASLAQYGGGKCREGEPQARGRLAAHAVAGYCAPLAQRVDQSPAAERAAAFGARHERPRGGGDARRRAGHRA